jgi:hypothetical protein
MRNIFQNNRQIGQFYQNLKPDNKLQPNYLAYLTNPKEKSTNWIIQLAGMT